MWRQKFSLVFNLSVNGQSVLWRWHRSVSFTIPCSIALNGTRIMSAFLTLRSARFNLARVGSNLRSSFEFANFERPGARITRLDSEEYVAMKTFPPLVLVLLAWSPFGVAGPAPQQVASANVWQQSQRTNAADAFTYSRFTLLGKFVTPSHDVVANRPAFVVDCIPANESPRDRGTFLAGNLVVGTTTRLSNRAAKWMRVRPSPSEP
jgi:hypothetical protein